VRGLQSIMKPLGLKASYYGHAASGLLHVRPVLDLHSAADLKKFRQVADQTSALVRQFKGSLSAEHGVGTARTEYMREQLGDELLGVMREIKRAFDPKNVFNPGKIFEAGSARCADPRKLSGQRGVLTKIDNHLRENFTKPLELPFKPRLAFAFKDGSFIGNLEQCNGCGGCRKDTPIMCPTFIATGEEIMSTRGRANIIRAALELRFGVRQHVAAFKSADMSAHSKDPLRSAELDAALSNCLSCKGCTPECPSNVNLALLKAEMLYARHQRDGLPLRERIFSSVDLLGRIGCATPRFANAIVDLAPVRAIMEKTLRISAKRSLPHYTRQRFDRWFAGKVDATPRRAFDKTSGGAPLLHSRGEVILWDDTFVRYHEPHIGIAAVKVLEALGFEVMLAHDRQCCGRPAFSQGNLDAAAKLGKHNVDLLNSAGSQLSSLRSATARQATNPPSPSYGAASNSQLSSTPILFLEPSCWSMFVDDYRELKIDNAAKVAARCFLFEKFIDDLLDREPDALQFRNGSAFGRRGDLRRDKQVNVAIHPHCHAKSLMNPAFMARLVERLPGRKAQLLDTGCCGMAGAFGALAEKYELSVQVAADLLGKIDNQPAGTEIIASGTSCRHQISDLTNVHPKHMAELIAEAIA
jgi:Fe-S oxidoreductase